MKKERAIIVDIDEVMLDHIGGLRKFVKKHYDIHPVGNPTSYDLTEWLGRSKTEVLEILKHFNERSYEFGLLKRLDVDALEYMTVLKRNFPDVKIIGLTKSGTGGHGEVLRRVNVENAYPGIIDELYIIEMYESKRGTLAKLKVQYDVQFLVDDHIDNIRAAQAVGVQGIMLKASHNVRFENIENDFVYVPNWYQLQRTMSYILNK